MAYGMLDNGSTNPSLFAKAPDFAKATSGTSDVAKATPEESSDGSLDASSGGLSDEPRQPASRCFSSRTNGCALLADGSSPIWASDIDLRLDAAKLVGQAKHDGCIRRNRDGLCAALDLFDHSQH